MEVKLSKSEVTEIANEVVRLLKEQGLVNTASQDSAAGERPAAKKAAPAVAKTPAAAKKPAAAPAAQPATSDTSSTGATAGYTNNTTYNIAGAAKAKGYHQNTIRRAIKSGKLVAKIGKAGHYEIKQRDLDKFSI